MNIKVLWKELLGFEKCYKLYHLFENNTLQINTLKTVRKKKNLRKSVKNKPKETYLTLVYIVFSKHI